MWLFSSSLCLTLWIATRTAFWNGFPVVWARSHHPESVETTWWWEGLLKPLVAHDTYYDPVEAYVCEGVLLSACDGWDTFLIMVTVLRFQAKPGRFKECSHQLLVCKHEIAWVLYQSQNVPNHGFWMVFHVFFGSKRFLRSQLKFSCQKLFRLQQGARGCTVFLPLGWVPPGQLRRRRLLPPCLTPWIRVGGVSKSPIVGYTDIVAVFMSISLL